MTQGKRFFSLAREWAKIPLLPTINNMLPSDAIAVNLYSQPLYEGYYVGSFGSTDPAYRILVIHMSPETARIILHNEDWHILTMIDWPLASMEDLSDPVRVMHSMVTDPDSMDPCATFCKTALCRRVGL